jgi:hypothetical protein
MMTTTRHDDAALTNNSPVTLPDSLHDDTAAVLAMVERLTRAANRGDTDGLIADMSQRAEAFTWDGDARLHGSRAVADFVRNHRALVPSSDIEFGPPRVVFDGDTAWICIAWAWSVSAGEAWWLLAREDERWRMVAIDLTGARVRTPDPDFDPRPAVRALGDVVSLLSLLDGALQSGREQSARPVSRESLGAMVAGAGVLSREHMLACLVDLGERLDCAKAPVTVCARSGRALALIAGEDGVADEVTVVLELQLVGTDWRLCGVRPPDTDNVTRPHRPRARHLRRQER